MSCPSRQDILEAVNAASDPDRLQAHLAACAECRALYDGMMGATEILTTTPYSDAAGVCLDAQVVAAYARRTVPAETEAEVETHLAACGRCREDLLALVETLEEGEAAGEIPASLAGRVGMPAGGCPSRDLLLEAASGGAPDVEAHARSCAPCGSAYRVFRQIAAVFARAPLTAPAGPCPDEAAHIAYSRRRLPEADEAGFEAHLAACAGCRDEVVALVDALDALPADVPAALSARILGLLVEPRRRSGTGRIHRVSGTFKVVKRKAPVLPWIAAAAAAAALLVGLVVLAGGEARLAPAAKTRKSEPARIEVAREEKKEEPRIVQGPPEPRVEPKPAPLPPAEGPKPLVKIEEPKPAPVVPKEDPKPVVKIEAPPKPPDKPSTVAETKPLVKYMGVRVTAVQGVLYRGADKLAKDAQLARGDEVSTNHRHMAALTADAGFAMTFEKGTSCRVERQEGGETRVALQKGKAFFAVEKRDQPFIVSTPAADVVVVGTRFTIEMDEKNTALHVIEGSVKFKNPKGEVLVNGGQRSAARVGAKPSTPARADVASESAWARRPELVGDAKADVWIDHAQGGNKKFPGLVVAHPYYEGEVDSGRLAKVLSESMDVGLVLGHNHRNMGLKIWMNVDRGLECEVKDDGTRGPLKVTPRMKQYTDEYLEHMKAAAGLGPKQAVPMVVCLREQNYTAKGGGALDVCEVAWTGFPRRTIEQLKTLYGQLLDRHKPAYRMEMRFEGIDERYLLRGTEQTFRFTEGDAESDGYLATRHAQTGITFFLTSNFGAEKSDIEAYNRILTEMIEFLWARRR